MGVRSVGLRRYQIVVLNMGLRTNWHEQVATVTYKMLRRDYASVGEPVVTINIVCAWLVEKLQDVTVLNIVKGLKHPIVS